MYRNRSFILQHQGHNLTVMFASEYIEGFCRVETFLLRLVDKELARLGI
jgi:hypothetical protein